jgi:hypothetical protein
MSDAPTLNEAPKANEDAGTDKAGDQISDPAAQSYAQQPEQ